MKSKCEGRTERDQTNATVGFRWKDYRRHGKAKVMTLAADEFIRRFLLHTLPDGFHRIRHYGFLANRQRAAKLALGRQLLDAPSPELSAEQVRVAFAPCPRTLPRVIFSFIPARYATIALRRSSHFNK
jgi:hypothetical protein